jgi:hypothetical protein
MRARVLGLEQEQERGLVEQVVLALALVVSPPRWE